MPSQHVRAPRMPILALLALILFWMRWHTYGEPRERDLDIYAWIGHYLLQGRPLYSDLVDIKPPLPYLLYALAERLVGFGASEVFWLGIASAWATLLGLYWFGVRVLGRPWLGVVAAACWVLFGSDLHLQANQPNTEAFINAFMIWGVALLWAPDRSGVRRDLGIGALFACATLCKTVMIAPAALLALSQPLLARDSVAQATKRIACIAAGGAGLWLLAFVWLVAAGAASHGWQILFEYPAEYARIVGSGPVGNILSAFLPSRFMPGFFAVHAWIVLACVAAAFFKLRSDPMAARLLLWAFGTFVAVALPGHFSPHYYQLWLPWLCIALPLSIEWSATALAQGKRRIAVGAAMLIFAAAWCALRLLPQYRLDATQWSVAKYKGTFVNTQALGQRLGAQLKPEQRLFVFGVFPGIYEAAGREPESGVLNIWLALPRYGGSLSSELSQRVLEDLRTHPPDLIVLDAYTCAIAHAPGQPVEPILAWINERYRIVNDRANYSLAVPATTPLPEGTANEACPKSS